MKAGLHVSAGLVAGLFLALPSLSNAQTIDFEQGVAARPIQRSARALGQAYAQENLDAHVVRESGTSFVVAIVDDHAEVTLFSGRVRATVAILGLGPRDERLAVLDTPSVRPLQRVGTPRRTGFLVQFAVRGASSFASVDAMFVIDGGRVAFFAVRRRGSQMPGMALVGGLLAEDFFDISIQDAARNHWSHRYAYAELFAHAPGASRGHELLLPDGSRRDLD